MDMDGIDYNGFDRCRILKVCEDQINLNQTEPEKSTSYFFFTNLVTLVTCELGKI